MSPVGERERQQQQDLIALINADPWRMAVLSTLRERAPYAWVAAGFIRNLVWDIRFGAGCARPLEDVDVLIMDQEAADPAAPEKLLEAELSRSAPDIPWSVKNQARMHLRNGDQPYKDISDAMSFWLETATGIGVRLDRMGRIEIISAYGLEDLMAGVLRLTASGLARPQELAQRIASKGWVSRWPGVQILTEAQA